MTRTMTIFMLAALMLPLYAAAIATPTVAAVCQSKLHGTETGSGSAGDVEVDQGASWFEVQVYVQDGKYVYVKADATCLSLMIQCIEEEIREYLPSTGELPPPPQVVGYVVVHWPEGEVAGVPLPEEPGSRKPQFGVPPDLSRCLPL